MQNLYDFHEYISAHPRRTENQLIGLGVLPRRSYMYKWKKIILTLKNARIRVAYEDRSMTICDYIDTKAKVKISSAVNFQQMKIAGNAAFVITVPVSSVWDNPASSFSSSFITAPPALGPPPISFTNASQ